MFTTRPRRRLVAVLSVATLALGLGACSSGTPEGFREVTQGKLRVAVPEGWVDGTVSGGYDLALQDVAGDSFTVRLLASSDYPATSARGAIDQIQTFSGIEGDESGGVSQVEREDDREMWTWDVTYDDGAYHLVAWALRDGAKDTTVVVTLSGTGTLAPDLVEDVRDSIDVVDGE